MKARNGLEHKFWKKNCWSKAFTKSFVDCRIDRYLIHGYVCIYSSIQYTVVYSTCFCTSTQTALYFESVFTQFFPVCCWNSWIKQCCGLCRGGEATVVSYGAMCLGVEASNHRQFCPRGIFQWHVGHVVGRKHSQREYLQVFEIFPQNHSDKSSFFEVSGLAGGS